MAARRVLLLGTYPIDIPLHGGQRRSRAIVECYRRCGWQAEHVAVYPRRWYRRRPEGWRGWLFRSPVRSTHFELPKTFARYLRRNGLLTDLHTERFFEQSKPQHDRLVAVIEGFRPDVVQFEQPWLYPVVRDYLQRADGRYRVVYSSQNPEAHLLKSILAEEGHPNAEAFASEAASVEQSLVATSDLTICVTEADADLLRPWDPRRVLIAPNGSQCRPCPKRSAWDKRLRDVPYALVTGSAHPPNGTGFLTMLGTELDWVPAEAKIVVAGGMVRLLEAAPQFQQAQAGEGGRALLVPQPSEEDLGYLIHHARLILLPITHGGGSNIKTAEALLSQRPVLGTSTAMRGFEAFADSPGLSVEDDPERFRDSLTETLLHGESRPIDRPGTERLRWEHCVAGIPAAVETLLTGSH